nr:hypothetical protein [Brevundimonas naejangsanensis]
MTKPIPRFIGPTVVVFAVLAVAFAGLGGMLMGEKVYPLFGVGALFCLCMILVFEIILSGLVTQRAMIGLAAGQGALMGACASLFFLPGSGLLVLLGYTSGGAVVGAVSFWWYRVRNSILIDR